MGGVRDGSTAQSPEQGQPETRQAKRRKVEGRGERMGENSPQHTELEVEQGEVAAGSHHFHHYPVLCHSSY